MLTFEHMRKFKLFLPALLVLSLLLSIAPTASLAAGSQGGADMVLINPKGGQQADGSDGMQLVFNGAGATDPSSWNNFDGYVPAVQSNPGSCPQFRQTNGSIAVSGSDQAYFMQTGQYNWQGEAPVLFIGDTLYGEAGPAINDSLNSSFPGGTSWSSIEIVSTSGSVLRVPAGVQHPDPNTFPDLGSGSSHIRYKVTRNGLDYIIDRYSSYTYPNNFYTDRYEFTIPEGNTEKVVFYKGGDATPGNCDDGIAFKTTNPGQTLYAMVPSAQIYVGYGEIPGSTPFSHWYDWHWSSNDYPPFAWMYAGQDLDDNVNNGVAPPDPNNTHDNSLNIQWSFPESGGVTTPGTYTREMFTTVGQQNTQVEASFTDPDILTSETSDLEIQILNSTFNDVTGTAEVSLPLPSGLTIAGAFTNSCGGTVTATQGGTTITLTGGSVSQSSNCVIKVPVQGRAGDYQVSDQDFTVGAGIVKGYGVSNLKITGPPTPPTPPTPPAPSTDKQLKVEVTAGGSVTSEPSGVNCGSTCEANYSNGTKVKLTAKPNAGYKFSKWEGACTGTANPCEVDMSEARSVKAVFVQLTAPNLSLKITAGKNSLKGGQQLPITLNVENTGETTAANATTCFTIPSGFSFISATRPYILKGKLVCWQLGDLKGAEVQSAESKQLKVNLRALKSVKSGNVNLRAAAAAENTESSKIIEATAKTKVKVKKAKHKPKPVTG